MKNDSSPLGDLGPLSQWAPELAEAFVRLSSDIALIVRPDGTIEKVVQSGASPLAPAAIEWVGRPWADTVTGDTRTKIENLIKEVVDTGVGRRREVNHPSSPGNVMNAIPVAYTALRLGVGGPLLAVGRDLRAIAAIQQRFLDVQRETEKVYWRARQADSRYQLLFQAASDAMLLIDGQSRLILEANGAAATLFEVPAESLSGKQASFGFDRHSAAFVEELMAATQAGGRQPELRVRLMGKLVYTSVGLTPFRVNDQLRLLMRVRLEQKPSESTSSNEAVVLTDSSGRILTGNRTFCALLEAGVEEQLRGRSLREWLGDALDAYLRAVRSEGLVRYGAQRVEVAGGRVFTAQLSAVILNDDDQERIAFTLVPQPEPVATFLSQSAPALSPAALTECLGNTSLRAMLERAETLLITAALERSGGDEEATARLLGLSLGELKKKRHPPLFDMAPRETSR
jgi:transcriptional regulator PpsR